MPIASSVRREIEARLRQIEIEEGVCIFYACESGSRAWGFPSANSDYDVRFLYAHPQAWYLSIDVERKRDVIERPINDDLDISGWDLRKALQLLRKSNPPLLEWLQSPIVYCEVSAVAAQLRALLPAYYSPRAAMHHYLHMARGNFRSYLQSDLVSLKKYFYVLRPLLAIKWIEADLGAVPMEFDVLVERLIDNTTLKQEIATLLAAKRAGDELDQGPRIAPISTFIETELARLETTPIVQQPPKPSVEGLNTFFREALFKLAQ